MISLENCNAHTWILIVYFARNLHNMYVCMYIDVCILAVAKDNKKEVVKGTIFWPLPKAGGQNVPAMYWELSFYCKYR